MTNKAITTIIFLFLLGSTALTQASPRFSIDHRILNLSSWVEPINDGKLELKIENDTPFNPLSDTSQPRGTQNWEESQSSFFIFPAIVLSIIALLLFFNRD